MSLSKEFENLDRQIKKILHSSEKEILKNYGASLEELRTTVRKLYDKYESEGKLTLEEMAKYDRLPKLEADIESSLSRLYAQNSVVTKAVLNNVAVTTLNKTVDCMDKAVNVKKKTKSLIPIKKTLNIDKTVNERMAGLHWAERLGKHRSDVIYNVNKTLKEGLAQGSTYRELSDRLKKELEGNVIQPMRIVRTEGGRVYAKTQEETLDKVANAGVKMIKTWKTSKDERVRGQKKGDHANHVAMEGVTVAYEEDFIFPDGKRTKMPRLSGYPEHDIHCRCFVMIDLVKETNAEQDKKVKEPVNIKAQEFVPSKTIEEAQEKSKQFISSDFSPTFKNEANFKGISLDHANKINQALEEIYTKMDIPKINGIKAISPTSAQGKKAFKDGADAIAAYNPADHGIFLNKSILKDEKSLANYMKQSDEAWNLVMKNIDKLSGTQKDLALQYKKAGRSLVDGNLQGLLTHEMGHHMQWQVMGTKMNDIKMVNPELISGYASATKGEYVAESFVAYMKGERDRVSSPLLKIFDEKLKSGYNKNTGFGIDLQLFANQDTEKQTVNQLKKGIRSYEKQIAKHWKKISNPSEYVSNWEDLSENRKKGLKEHWEHEIKIFNKNIEDNKKVLDERGE